MMGVLCYIDVGVEYRGFLVSDDFVAFLVLFNCGFFLYERINFRVFYFLFYVVEFRLK